MTYIKRDQQGKTSAISDEALPGFTKSEAVECKLIDFMIQGDSTDTVQSLRSDVAFIRVLEDVIDALIKKMLST